MKKKYDDSIRLSKKHGVNPMMVVCFFCNKDTGDIALMGQMKGDQEAPRRAVLDRTPCDTCKGHMGQGVIFISVNEKLTTDRNNPYRSGNWAVVTTDFVQRVVTPKSFADDICEKRFCFVPDDVWEKLGIPAPQKEMN